MGCCFFIKNFRFYVQARTRKIKKKKKDKEK